MEVNSALAAYNKVWQGWSNITASDVSQVQKAAMNEAIDFIVKECAKAVEIYIENNPNAASHEVRDFIIGRSVLLRI